MISASGAGLENGINNLDLIWRNQSGCMAAVFHNVHGSVAVSPQHALEDVFRQKVGLFALITKIGTSIASQYFQRSTL